MKYTDPSFDNNNFAFLNSEPVALNTDVVITCDVQVSDPSNPSGKLNYDIVRSVYKQ